jgi:hypothetical protein
MFSLQSLSVSADSQPEENSYVPRLSPETTILPDQEDPLCLVPCSDIVNGGPGKDGIPSIDDPQYYSTVDADADLFPSDVIMGVEIDGVMHGFPHNILNWHEIVNHRVQDAILSITYCPLTGTGIPYHQNSELGVSGQLYENNLLFYDRNTDSYWAQMYGLSVTGDRIGDTLEQGNMVEMHWSAFSVMYPDAQVLTRDTGYVRGYDSYPYSRYDYLNSETIIFPSSYDGDNEPYNLYHPKDLTVVLSVNGLTALISFSELAIDGYLSFLHNEIEVVVFYDESGRIATPFVNSLNGETLEFQLVEDSELDTSLTFGLNVYTDQFGNTWNQKGEIIDGPDMGETLIQLAAYNAFWFAATSFFPDAIIYQSDNVIELGGEQPIGSYTDVASAEFQTTWILALVAIPLVMRRRK